MALYAALAGAFLLLHLLWCAWVLLGWVVTLKRRVLRWLHIASLCYAVAIELLPWLPCPLTIAEKWAETQAGMVPARGPFLVRLLDAIVYPNLPQRLVAGGAVAACLAILGVYVRRYVRHSMYGM